MTISYVECSNTFARPLEQAAEGRKNFHGRKNFQNLLKNSAILDYFLALSHVFKYFCTEVYV